MDDPRALEVIRRYQEAEGNRGIWEAHWQEIAERVLPQYAGSFLTAGVGRPQGDKRNEKMIDATAALALQKFAAAMESMLTPRNSRWHGLLPSDRTLLRNRAVRMYFEEVTSILFQYRYAPKANYASQQHESYMGLGAFGTGALFLDKLDPKTDFGHGIRYRNMHLAEVYFLENHQGIIDTAFRRFKMTVRQAKQKWPDSLPPTIAKAAEEPTRSEQTFWFIHNVQPRGEEYDPQRLDTKGMRFASLYVSETDKAVVGEGGYNTFPYPISRYVVAPGELYGRGPAMLVLPNIKVLNEQKKTVLKQGHRAIDPVLLMHDDGVASFNMRPGAQNYGAVTADGKPLVHALPTGNLALAKEMMEAERASINDAFLVTLFQILVETPQMTATEVLERAREKGALLSPTMGRQQSEALGPMIERELDILASEGLLPEMPPILKQAKGQYEVMYDSPLSRSQRAEGAAGFMRTIDWATQYATASGDVSVFDNFDMDAAVPDLADTQGVKPTWLADAQTRAAKRAQRAQQAQTQQMIDAAPAAAGVLKSAPQLVGGAAAR